jgi:hypothetical protein
VAADRDENLAGLERDDRQFVAFAFGAIGGSFTEDSTEGLIRSTNQPSPPQAQALSVGTTFGQVPVGNGDVPLLAASSSPALS